MIPSMGYGRFAYITSDWRMLYDRAKFERGQRCICFSVQVWRVKKSVWTAHEI